MAVEQNKGTQQPAGNQGGAPAAGTGQQSGAGSAAGGGTQFPWQADERFRDKSPEDMWNQYREAEKIKGEYGELKKFREQVDADGGYDNIRGWANWAAQEYKRQQAAQANGGQQQQRVTNQQAQAASQATGIPAEYFKDYDLLPGPAQAEKLYQLLASQIVPAFKQYMDNQILERQNQVVQQLTGWQSQQQQQFDIYRQALEAGLKNPGLNVQDFIARAAKIATSGPDEVLKMALNDMTAASSREEAIKVAVAAERARWEQEQQNRAASSADVGGARTYRLPDPPANNKADENAGIIGKLLGQGFINSNQVA